MEPKFKNKLHENTCNMFISNTYNKLKSERGEKKVETKVDLTIKNVIFRNSTLVTYTYI